ncbi:hypothetical protein T484DRAFT_1987943, partial [Baffinella frigidus]
MAGNNQGGWQGGGVANVSREAPRCTAGNLGVSAFSAIENAYLEGDVEKRGAWRGVEACAAACNSEQACHCFGSRTLNHTVNSSLREHCFLASAPCRVASSDFGSGLIDSTSANFGAGAILDGCILGDTLTCDSVFVRTLATCLPVSGKEVFLGGGWRGCEAGFYPHFEAAAPCDSMRHLPATAATFFDFSTVSWESQMSFCSSFAVSQGGSSFCLLEHGAKRDPRCHILERPSVSLDPCSQLPAGLSCFSAPAVCTPCSNSVHGDSWHFSGSGQILDPNSCPISCDVGYESTNRGEEFCILEDWWFLNLAVVVFIHTFAAMCWQFCDYDGVYKFCDCEGGGCWRFCGFSHVGPSIALPVQQLRFIFFLSGCWILDWAIFVYWAIRGMALDEGLWMGLVLNSILTLWVFIQGRTVLRYGRHMQRICCAKARKATGVVPVFLGGCCKTCQSLQNPLIFQELGGRLPPVLNINCKTGSFHQGDPRNVSCGTAVPDDFQMNHLNIPPRNMEYQGSGVLNLLRRPQGGSNQEEVLAAPTFRVPPEQAAWPPPRFFLPSGQSLPPGIFLNPETGSIGRGDPGNVSSGTAVSEILGVYGDDAVEGPNRTSRNFERGQPGVEMVSVRTSAQRAGYQQFEHDLDESDVSLQAQERGEQDAFLGVYHVTIVAINSFGKAIFSLRITTFDQECAPFSLSYPAASSRDSTQSQILKLTPFSCDWCEVGRERMVTMSDHNFRTTRIDPDCQNAKWMCYDCCAGREVVDWGTESCWSSRIRTIMGSKPLVLCADCHFECQCGSHDPGHTFIEIPQIRQGIIFTGSRVRFLERDGVVIEDQAGDILVGGDSKALVCFDPAEGQEESVEMAPAENLEVVGWCTLLCGAEMVPLKPSVKFNFGCPFATFVAEPSEALPSGLPGGLQLDLETGIVSGTPAVVFDGFIRITAFNLIGQCSWAQRLDIRELDVPHSFSYSAARSDGKYTGLQFWLREDVEIRPHGPVCQHFKGRFLFKVSPALPAGLRLDQRTGIISGSPLERHPLSGFQVRAYFPGGGETSTVVNIKVAFLSRDRASEREFMSYREGQPHVPKENRKREGCPAIDFLGAKASGVDTDTYGNHLFSASFGEHRVFLESTSSIDFFCARFTCVPPLPRGLRFNEEGAVCGTPVVNAASTSYEITALNEYGEATARLRFGVQISGLDSDSGDLPPSEQPSGGKSLMPAVEGFELLRRLGEGAQGAVWLAMEDGGRDLVAIKISQKDGDPRAGRESRILHTVGRHPNIVLFKSHLEGVGGDPDKTALVMEFVQGTTLKAFVSARKTPRFKEEEAAWIMRGILGGLGQAMAQKDLDVRVDVWASGIILYELLRGTHPFKLPGTDDLELLNNIRVGRVKKLPPPAGDAVNWFLQTALSKDRADRFTNARFMLDAYEKACEQPGRVPIECAPVKEEVKDESFIIVVFTSRIGSKVDVHGEADIFKELYRNMDHVTFDLRAKPTAESFFGVVSQLSAKPVRIMHFAGHGDDGEEGFVWEASGGTGPEVVMQGTFSDVVKRVGSLECVVLNACWTVQAGYALHAANVPFVVCFDGEVPDKDGIEFCRMFYRHLSNRGNEALYGAAYEHACDWASHTRSKLTPCLLWNDGRGVDGAFTQQHGAAGTCSWKHGALALPLEREAGSRESHGAGGGSLDEIVVQSDVKSDVQSDVGSDAEPAGAEEIRNWRKPRNDRDWAA